MTIDLTGGLDLTREYPLVARPEAGFRDATNMWVMDDRGRFGFPKFSVEACAEGAGLASRIENGAPALWDRPEVKVNLAFADGRVFRVRTTGIRHAVEDEEGQPRVFGAGPIEFRCVKPFVKWTTSFRGQAAISTAAAEMAGEPYGPEVDLEFHIETTMVAPPWEYGSLNAQDPNERRPGGGLWGDAPTPGQETRIEQLLRASGTLRIDQEMYDFTGSGLRVRRRGLRRSAGFYGHIWQSAVFPSGKGFSILLMRSPTNGKLATHDAYVFNGDGKLLPARVVDASWLRTPAQRGDVASVTLESELGTSTISGETVLSTWSGKKMNYADPDKGFMLEQGGVRYEWDDEMAYGITERSSPNSELVRPFQASRS